MNFDISKDNEFKGMLEIESNASFKKKAYHGFITFEKAYDLIMEVASSPEIAETWFNKLESVEKENELMPSGTKRELWQYPDLLRKFKQGMRKEWNSRINSIHDIGRMAVTIEEYARFQPMYDFNPDSLIYPFIERNGILAQISGAMGLGKTDFGCLIGRLLIDCTKKRFNLITNIQFFNYIDDEKKIKWEKPDNLHECRRMTELLKKMFEFDSMGLNIVILWDESSQFFSRREPGKKSNIQLEKFLRLIRKYGVSIIFIEQIEGGLPTVAMDLMAVKYHKEALKKIHYSSRYGDRKYNNYLNNVPPVGKNKMPFNTHDMGSFVLDIDLDDMFSSIDVEAEKKEAIEKYVDDFLAGKIKDKEKKDSWDLNKAIEMHKSGKTFREIGEYFGIPHNTAWNKLKTAGIVQ